MANVPIPGMDTASLNNRAEFVSILVSKLPTDFLLPDLKELLLGHFANFGRILRISCATKGGRERTAHIQFSSSEEARMAQQTGRIMNGHSLIINFTAKIPDTKILSSPPKPLKKTMISTQNNPLLMVNENKVKMQANLASYFQRQAAVKEEKKNVNLLTTANSTLGPVPIASTSYSERKPNVINQIETTIAEETSHLVDSKPNTCVKIEVYNSPASSQSQSQGQCSRNLSSSIAVNTQDTVPQATLRPARSLSEILNIDTTNMKIVKTVTASDALACQMFRGGPHPFPLSLMFGRIPGSVIMPVKTIMDSIKPGLEIDESTVNTVWNTLLTGVLKSTLQKSAKAILRENLVSKFVAENYQELEEKIVHKEVVEAAEREVGYEEDIMICCEDVMEALLGLVCSSMIQDVSAAEFRRNQAISKVVTCCYRKLTKIVVTDIVGKLAYPQVLECLCEEVVDDLLYSSIFELHVKVVAAEALKQGLVEDRKESSGSNSANSSPADRSLHILSELLPQIDQSQQISNWLQTSCDNIQVDYYESDDDSISSIETNISCSQGSSQASVSSVGESTVAEIPNWNVPIPDVSVASRPIAKQVTDGTTTGLFATFKRKVLSWYKTPNKKPKLGPEIQKCDDQQESV